MFAFDKLSLCVISSRGFLRCHLGLWFVTYVNNVRAKMCARTLRIKELDTMELESGTRLMGTVVNYEKNSRAILKAFNVSQVNICGD